MLSSILSCCSYCLPAALGQSRWPAVPATAWQLDGLGPSLPTPQWSSYCSLPKNPTSALGPLGIALRLSPLTQNRRLGPSQHDALDPPLSSMLASLSLYHLLKSFRLFRRSVCLPVHAWNKVHLSMYSCAPPRHREKINSASIYQWYFSNYN